jgi:glycosyltransferase involved in cell wall biosynthesis
MSEKFFKISLLSGGKDPTYVIPLVSALASKNIKVDFLGGDQMAVQEIMNNDKINFLNYHGDGDPSVSAKRKITRVIKMYIRYLIYVPFSDSKVFHIQWFNKVRMFDWTLMNIYYKMFGRKLVYTAHNINDRERDGNDTLLYRLSLIFMYKIVDHIFVHTEKMKQQLVVEYRITESKITVIPFGINNVIPETNINKIQARKKLNLNLSDRIILFFGNIAPYKGLEDLIKALIDLKDKIKNVKLIIGGPIKKNCGKYWTDIQQLIKKHDLDNYVITNISFIPNEEVEIFFKAADILALPYKFIYQSGPLFLAYNFGLPVIATDVGSFREDIVDGKTGYISKPDDPEDLAKTIEKYFESDLFEDLEINRIKIQDYANNKYSWEKVGDITYGVYKRLL